MEGDILIVDIEKIKVNNRIRKDFGDLQELANDIDANGLLQTPLVTVDLDLIAGERRLRACRDILKWKQIEVRPVAVRDAEHQLEMEISENEVRKDFSKAERIDYARRLERIEAAKAKERQATSTGGSEPQPVQKFAQAEQTKTRDVVAEKLGIGSGETYRKEKYISDNRDKLTPEDFADWDEGRLSTNKAYQRIKSQLAAAQKEHDQYIRDISDRDVQIGEQANELVHLRQKNQELQSNLDKAQKPETIMIDNTDYSRIQQLESKVRQLESQKRSLEMQSKMNQEDAEKFKKLKSDIEFLTQQKSDLSRQIDSATQLAELTVTLQTTLERDLAPIKFMRCMERLDISDVARQNLVDIVNLVDKWSAEMHSILKKENIVMVDYGGM